MKTILSPQQKQKVVEYEQYKRLIRNLRRGKVETASSKKVDNSLKEDPRG